MKKQYIIEGKGFTNGIGSAKYRKEKQKKIEELKKQLAKIKKQIIMNDKYLEDGNPNEYEDKEYECAECSTPVSEEGAYCNRKCWEASMI
jgi:hypothetical protein